MVKKLKKKFFEVEIEILNKSVSLLSDKIENLGNRFIKYDLSKLLRGKNTILTLKTIVKEGKVTSEATKIQILQPFFQRVMRKNVSYVEDSFSGDCEDGSVKIKPFLVTRRKVHRSVRKALRDKTKIEILEYLKTKKTQDLFKELIKGRIQKTISLKLKKIYPLSFFDIRILKVESSKD